MTDLLRRDWMKLIPASLATAGLVRGAAGATEARAVWLHLITMFDPDPAKGKEQIHATVGRLAEHNFNLILPWVTSEYLSALDGDAEFRAKCPGAKWDSLGVLLDESARAGLAVDMWYGPTEYREPTSPDYLPRLGGDPNWSAIRITEFRADAAGKIAPRKWEDVCLQHAGARNWQLKRLDALLKRYPKLGGLHIEEPGYSYRGNCVCDLCREVFAKLYDTPLADALNTSEAEDYRVLGTSFFMAELKNLLRKSFPKVVFSANGGPDWRHDRKLGRDWGRWGRSGWLDYYASQVYETDTAKFKRKLALTVKDLSPECPVYGGIAFNWSEGKNTVEEVMRQIEASREVGARGVCLFFAGSFTPEFYKALKAGPFRAPAALRS